MNSQLQTDTSLDKMQALLQQQRQAFTREGHVGAEVRIARLDKALDLIFDNRDQLVEALNEDFGGRSKHQSLMSDIYNTLEVIKFNKKHLRKWMRPDKRKVAMPMRLFGAKARVEYQPKGVVGVLGTWNFPIYTVIAPMVGALAAGNRVMVKFSEVTPTTAALMGRLIEQYYEEEVVACVTGGPAVGEAFSSLGFDHILFTGAGSIGKHVMRAAAETLTPVTLELGGKSPVIIARDADIRETAVRILAGKTLNSGQVCLSPDYLFVPEEKLQEFLKDANDWAAEAFPTKKDNPDFTSVVNERHYQRLLSYLEDAKGKGADVRPINPANENFSVQEGSYKIPFTFVIDPTDDMMIMREEIFGPLIPIKTYRDVDECIGYINANPHPLGLYLFTNDKALQRRVLDHTLSGGVTINDVFAHVSTQDLPFGGIGPSGMGNYHGAYGFKTFSHSRAVYTQTRINLQRLGGMMPPYDSKSDKTLEGMIKK